MATDPYQVLGVAGDAKPEEIQRAYRTLARRRHPASTPRRDVVRAAAARAGPAGALYAEVKIMVPATLTEPQRRLLRHLGAVSRFDPRDGRPRRRAGRDRRGSSTVLLWSAQMSTRQPGGGTGGARSGGSRRY